MTIAIRGGCGCFFFDFFESPRNHRETIAVDCQPSSTQSLSITGRACGSALEHTPPIVVVGNGPVGMRMVRELLSRVSEQRIVVYGEEQHEPYDRVRLSAWVAVEIGWHDLAQPISQDDSGGVETKFGYRIVGIDRQTKTVVDDGGDRIEYQKLVLATGSSPHVPNIPGVDKPGVFTFRDLDDANQLIARRARSRQTVVIGGGLLGLECARGMQRVNTRVSVVETASYLLSNQLDEPASNVLQSGIEELGIRIHANESVVELVWGSGQVGAT